MALDQAFAKSLNDFMHGTAAPTVTTSRKLKLVTTTTPSVSAANTEITAGGGYTAGGVALTFTAATTATPSVASNAAVSITNMPAAAAIGAIEITDTTATAVRIEVGAITGGAKTTNAGDTLSFSAAAITSSLQ